LIVQLLPPPKVAGRLPHVVLATANWPAFRGVPVTEMAVILSAVLPVLVSVTVEAVLVVVTTTGPNGTLVGLKETAGPAAATPVPVMDTDSGLSLALSVTDSDAEAEPTAVGLKVTEMTQLLPAVRVVPQGLLRLNWFELAPMRAILLIVSEASPMFLSVTVRAALLVFTV